MVFIENIKFCFAVLITAQLSTLHKNHNHQGHAQPISALKTRHSTDTQLYNLYLKSKVKLFSRTRMFLQIDQNGKVNGTSNCSSQFVNLEMSYDGRSLVRIKGVASGRYLAMSSDGNIYSTVSANDETVLKYMDNKAYESFASNIYYQKVFYDTFVGIRKNGKTKNGRRTKLSQKNVQFLFIELDSNPC